jgi:sortase A
VRTALRTFGEILITLGAVLLLFFVYEVWWTTYLANRAADRNAAQIERTWTDPDPKTVDQAPPAVTTEPPVGTPFALLTIPRLGDNVSSKPVVQGVDFPQLAEGVGHYPGSAMPGQPGNFAVAGHRISYGEPFRRVDTLQDGDNAYVETETYWYTYRLFRSQLVPPDATWVIGAKPFPDDPNAPESLFTLTTCNPEYGNSERWIWWGELIASSPKPAPAPTMVVNG